MNALQKTGNEYFCNGTDELPFSLLNFWQWSASDLVSNALRGRLAEFIVAQALGTAEGVRREWDAFDVKSKSGAKVEVKSAAYIQTWKQKSPAKIVFGIAPTRSWNNETGEMAVECFRNSDVYVFALLAHRDKKSLDPLNVAQWKFYVLRTEELNCSAATQKQIGLDPLRKLGAVECKYDELAETVESAYRASKLLVSTPRG